MATYSGDFLMKDNFKDSLSEVLEHEGGYVDHQRDPGGATNQGITRATLSKWRGRAVSKKDVKNISSRTVAAIYKANYWDRIKGDDLPLGLDYAVFDFAVNSGVSRSVIFLQNLVAVTPDGRIGPITLKAIKTKKVGDLIHDLCDSRLLFLKRLSTWGTFGKGWGRRVARVRTTSLHMATHRQPDDPGVVATKKPEGAMYALLRGLFSFLRQLFRKGN